VSGVHVRLRVAGESYAFGVEHVLEVSELGVIAPVPSAPDVVIGVTNLRGQVLPVFELASVLGIAREGVAANLLVVEHEGRRAGFAIDEVLDVGVLAVPSEETESNLLHGASLVDGELVGVVDVPQLFRTLVQAEA